LSLKSRRKKLPQDVNLKTSTSNLFLNVTIIILVLIVAFLTYSIAAKIRVKNELDNVQKRKKAGIIQVEVLNGCGISGVADKFTEFLRKDNFDVVQMGNYRSFDVNKTLVIDRTGNILNADKVAKALGVDSKNVIQQINKDYFLDVTIIIGKDFNDLNPFK
jgi:calcineurin-like phosphoesterase